jgi:EAL and modified HD-GYP domain-containing signal transduction protein
VPIDQVMAPNDALAAATDVVSTDPEAAPASAHIVRQPIYDATVKVVGYELIVHGDERTGDADASAASTVTQIGLNMVGGGAAWVPLSRGFLSGGHATALPPDRVVFEVAPELGNDPQALADIGRLKSAGFGIAIDPFTAGDDVMPLLAMASAVKLDGKLDRATLAEHAAAARLAGAQIVAKNVDTHDALETLKELGFDYFQGAFLCEPKVVEGRPIQINNLNRLRLVAELQNPDVDMPTLGKVVSRDVGLSYNLLRFVNSAFFAVPRRIASIREALVLLGLGHIRRWATLMALFQSNDKPHELIVTGLVRARMCELIANARGERRDAEEYFTTGLFSVVDALMDISLIEVLRQLPFSEEIMDALLQHEGKKGELLHGVLAYERGDFGELIRLVPAGTTPADFYTQAVEWATEAGGGLVAVPDSPHPS